jgi:TolB-like protein
MRSFFEELRHRNVIRVGIAYVIAAWLFVQVADIVTESFAAPEWVMRVLIILLLVGLPVALFLAWAFELTPEGVVKAEDVPEDAPKDPRAGKRLNAIIMVALVVAVAWLGWDKLQDKPTAAAPEAVVTDKSIAVLPFADFSPEGDQAWFADGLTGEILNALARTRDLRVASRSSAFQYRGDGQNIPDVAAALGVAHILEGSVRRSGDRVRVTAQLIRASDDAHLWSETFDASSDDSIEIQESIAFEIASLLDTAMDPEELTRMVAAGTDSIAAWESYLRMNELLIQATDQFNPTFGNAEILALYRGIVAEDPGFGDAHAAFARISLGWLDLADITTAPAGYSADDVEKLFADASAAATEHARSEEARLKAEILRARVQLRVSDLVDLTLALVEMRPQDPDSWDEHISALIQASRFDAARAFVGRAASHEFDADRGLETTDFILMAARVDLPFGLARTEALLANPTLAESDYYQAHRIFLYADRVEEAAELARRYIASANNPTWSLMVKIRQACAEGRVADADAIYADYEYPEIGESRSNIQWLALQTLGRRQEAVDLTLPLDSAGKFFALSGFLTYTHFDPRPYPNLAATLSAQGVLRDSPAELNFACKRD